MSARAIGYVRVSRVGGRDGDRFLSPVLQRDSSTSWGVTARVTLAVDAGVADGAHEVAVDKLIRAGFGV